jgi:hypothetical protein
MICDLVIGMVGASERNKTDSSRKNRNEEGKVNVKVKRTLFQATKAPRWSKGMALLFL